MNIVQNRKESIIAQYSQLKLKLHFAAVAGYFTKKKVSLMVKICFTDI